MSIAIGAAVAVYVVGVLASYSVGRARAAGIFSITYAIVIGAAWSIEAVVLGLYQ